MTTPAGSDDALRELAVKNLRKRRDFKSHVFMYVLVNVILVAIWALTGAGYFWPIFPILGWGLGVVANAWDVYWRKPITEDEIRREADRLRAGGSGGARARGRALQKSRRPPPVPRLRPPAGGDPARLAKRSARSTPPR